MLFPMISLMKMTARVLEKYHTICLYLLVSSYNPDYLQMRSSMDYVKNLIRWNNLQVTVISMQELLDRYKDMKCQENIPFYLIMNSDKNTQGYLRKFSSGSIFPSARWLMFLSNDVQIDHYFKGIHIPHDCEYIVVQKESKSTVTLTEIYNLHPEDPLQKQTIAEWHNDSFKWTQVSLLKRRGNLRGHQIRASIFDDEKVFLKSKCSGFEKESFCRQHYEIWNMIQRQANITTRYLPYSRNYTNFGNDSWHVPIVKLIENEADVAVSSYGMTPERMREVSYISNAFPEKVKTYIKETDKISSLDSFLEPFTMSLWCTIFISLVTLAALLSSTCWLKVRLKISSSEEDYSFNEAWMFVFGSFCRQGHENASIRRAWSSRLIFLTTHLTYLIVVAYYSAIVVSFLTVQHHYIPFSGYKGLLDIGTYDFGTYRNKLYPGLFQRATNPAMRSLYEKFLAPRQGTLPEKPAQGLRLICKKKRYAFALVEEELDLNKPTCGIMEVPQTTFYLFASFLIQKKSPYYRIFTHYLENLRRFGFLDKVNSMQSPRVQVTEEHRTQADIENVLASFLILFAGCLISLVLLAAERCLFKC
ncbi:Ionotropic receptor 164 [Blattella germanica]|nr:Ionotropic receptor 164 [Blattella germanica]